MKKKKRDKQWVSHWFDVCHVIGPTLKPSSPGFSGSKSYIAEQHGPVGFCWAIGVLAGERIGDGNGEAVNMYQITTNISNSELKEKFHQILFFWFQNEQKRKCEP